MRQLVATTAIAAVTLSACGFVNTGEENAGETATTLTAYVSTEQNVGLEPLFQRFERKTGTTVDASHALVDELNKQLRIQLTSGTAADVFRVSPGFSSPVAAGVLGKEGELADLSDGSWTDKLPDDARALAESDGKIVAFPIGRNALVMAYNKQLFADAGVDVPTTWSEFKQVCERLKANGTTPIATAFAEGVALQFWVYALASTLVYAEDPDLDKRMMADEEDFVDNEAWREVFDKFLELRDAGYMSPDALGVPYEQGPQLVATGEAAMTLLATPALAQLAELSENGAEDFGIFALPATDNAEDTHIPTAPDFLAVNASAKNPDAAKRLVEFLAKPENVVAYADAVSTLPGLDVDLETKNPTLEPIRPYLEEGRTTAYANYAWPNGDVQQTLLQSGQELFDGSITVDELLARMDADYDKGTP